MRQTPSEKESNIDIKHLLSVVANVFLFIVDHFKIGYKTNLNKDEL